MEFSLTDKEEITVTIITTNMNLNINKLIKPTATDTTSHFISNHPMQHKLAAYRYHIHRTHTLPLLKQNKVK